MTIKTITERELIDFAYHKASFSNHILPSLQKEFEFLKRQDIVLLSKEFKTNQLVKLEHIKGSYEVWPPKEYAGKTWIDIVIEEGYIRDDVETLFRHLNSSIHECNHNVGAVTLFNVHGTYFIKNGHKRIALARYFYEFHNTPAYLTGVNVIDCKFIEDESLPNKK